MARPPDADQPSPLHQLLAGAITGVVADVTTHPLSTIKTRLQCQGAGVAGETSSMLYRGTASAMVNIIQTEGVLSLYRGIGAVVAAAAPAQAMYFGGYELVRAIAGSGTLSTFGAGMVAQLCGSVIWVPMDVVKERLMIEGQLKTRETYGSSLNAVKQIVRSEGIAGLYRAYWLHQAVWVPFNGLYFALYEETKKVLAEKSAAENNALVNFASSAFASSCASVATSPFDLVKTRLQVQRSNPDIFCYSGPADALTKIVKKEGWFALMDGVGARVLWLTPRLSIAMTTYEATKDWVSNML